MERGIFILFEGADKSGKTTQANLLSDLIPNSKYISFPNRTTSIGKIITSHLCGEQTIEPHALHLLFSANRWEIKQYIESLLNDGVNVIMDRYIYSGIVYSVVNGLRIEWCLQSDKGLVVPDMIFLLDVKPKIASKRGDYGREKFEKIEIQEKVRMLYKRFVNDKWRYIDGNQTKINVFKDVQDNLFKNFPRLKL